MDLVTYYAKRAAEYEAIYQKPERQSDLRELENLLRRDFAGRNVLEIACGTGYWTERVASVADSIVALDINESVLEIARQKELSRDRVEFALGDNYALPAFGRKFSGGFAGFWWSHVPKQRQAEFLAQFVPQFCERAVICFFDNRYVEGSSTPISRRGADGNTYQIRKLADGSCSEVPKNFFTAAELAECFKRPGMTCGVVELSYYWYARLEYRKVE